MAVHSCVVVGTRWCGRTLTECRASYIVIYYAIDLVRKPRGGTTRRRHLEGRLLRHDGRDVSLPRIDTVRHHRTAQDAHLARSRVKSGGHSPRPRKTRKGGAGRAPRRGTPRRQTRARTTTPGRGENERRFTE